MNKREQYQHVLDELAASEAWLVICETILTETRHPTENHAALQQFMQATNEVTE
jgi:hypothetical protein